MIQRVLKDIYDSHNLEFTYCGYYSDSSWTDSNGVIHNCGCGETPCARNCEFQKNHDFSLELEINDNCKYIVIYREDETLQLESMFRCREELIELREQSPEYSGLLPSDKYWKSHEIERNKISRLRINYEDRNTFNNLIEYYTNYFKEYYTKFINKWVFNDHDNVIRTEYSEFTDNPSTSIHRILHFINNKSELIESDIKTIISNRKEKIIHNSAPHPLSASVYYAIKAAI